ncbi:DUF6779 domain-containing protein [Amycolatopsis sp. FDAARGOS 1241]|uniref:DUF6779 domain-containing protein n=1 Tax=Amycolatopsis sp. FDAARGOS 1241 TaxID=2778070 RepID=UPI00194F47C0|nr:DUF6779 domain-containing protein [Amycolatopsis sp. FDAARGOS 1241]QRP46598.1 hypothetical protein I6J71_00470 [Amycolatopsis sp. FDAARGOS 1241]
MTGVGDDSRGRLVGRPWLVVGFLLAIGATLALVLSDDLRFLRLGIVAALWAALIGAFLSVRYRKHAAHSEDEVAEAQAVYELELEREIAARREYELEIEAETREAAEAKSREELDALRAEVASLRESLQSLFGGEVLLERVALTAQATRMRALNDEQRLVPAGSESKNGNGKKPAQLLAPKKPVVEVNERPTELIDRVVDDPGTERRRKQAGGAAPHGPGTQHGPGQGQGPNGKPQTLRTQQLARQKPAGRPQPSAQAQAESESAAARAVKAAELRAEAARRQAAESAQPTRTVPAVPKPDALEATRQVPRAELQREASRPAMRPASRAEASRPGLRRVESAAEASRPAMRRVESPSEVSRGDLPRVGLPTAEPAGESTAARKPAWDASADFAERRSTGGAPPKPREAAASRTDLQPVTEKPQPAAEEPAPRKPSRLEQFSRADLSPLAESAPSTRHGAHSTEDAQPEEPAVNPTLPEAVRSSVAKGKSGGRRRRSAEDDAADTAAGGRRRRPDGEPPAWEGMVSERASQSRRSMPAVDADDEAPGRRGAADTGSHAAGRSVTELLAANGAKKEGSPRRRRRAED